MRVIEQLSGLGVVRPNEASAAQRIVNVQARLEALYAERAQAEAIECGVLSEAGCFAKTTTLNRLAPIIQREEAELALALKAQSDLQAAQAAAPAKMAATGLWLRQRDAQAEDARVQAELDAKLAAEKKIRDAAASAYATAERQRVTSILSAPKITAAQKRTLKVVEQAPGKEAFFNAGVNLSPFDLFKPKDVAQGESMFTGDGAGSGIPTWAYVLGGLAVVGVAVYLGRRK